MQRTELSDYVANTSIPLPPRSQVYSRNFAACQRGILFAHPQDYVLILRTQLGTHDINKSFHGGALSAHCHNCLKASFRLPLNVVESL